MVRVLILTLGMAGSRKFKDVSSYIVSLGSGLCHVAFVL
jgi:hypothetical protein